jgi:Ni/Fe-hydrogenase subunit HybB-like protein
MDAAKKITRAETTGSAALWYGILAGPLVWAGQLILNYGLPDAVACAPGSRTRGEFFNVGIRTVIQITNAVAAALVLLALAIAVRCYLRLRRQDETVAMRARWMATAGLFNSALFLILICLKFASPAVLSACGYSP